MSDDEFSGDTQDIRWDDRSHIIKALQEQVQALLCYKNDHEQMQKRCRIAEQALQLRETEIKLKFDEMEDLLSSVTEENQELKERLAKGIHRNNTAVPLQDENTASEYYEKYQKWKAKYAALLNTKASSTQSGDNSALRIAYDKLQQENQELKDEMKMQREQIQKLTSHLKSNITETKGSTKSVVDFQKKYEKLKAEHEALKQEKEKLVDKSKQKTSLLKHTRTQQEKQRKARQQAESTLEAELEKERTKNKQSDMTITQLNNNLSIERETVKKLKAKYMRLKTDSERVISTLEAKIGKFECEIKRSFKKIDEYSASTMRLESDIEDLQHQKSQLEVKVAEGRTAKNRNSQLEGTIANMQKHIQELEEVIDDEKRQIAELERNVQTAVVKSGNPDAIEWTVDQCIANFREAYSARDEYKDTIATQEMTITKLQKKVKSLTTQVATQKKIIQEKNDALSSAPADTSEHGCLSESASEVNFAPQIVLKQLPDPFESINRIRHRAVRSITKMYFKLRDEVAEFVQAVNPPEEEDSAPVNGLSMRSCILVVIGLRRWLTFKKADELDNRALLAYVGDTSRTEQSAIKHITKSVVDKIALSRSLETSNSLLSKANGEITEGKRKLEKEVRNLREEVRDRDQRIKDVERELKYAQSRCETLIEPDKLVDVESRCAELTRQKKSLEHQLSCMKTEMKNLLDSADCGMNEVGDLQVEITELAQENEQYRQHILNLEHELSMTKVALNNKIREYLAMERKMLKQRDKCVIVKDRIPATQQIMTGKSETDAADGRFLSEDIRCGLDRMRHRIIQSKNDPLI